MSQRQFALFLPLSSTLYILRRRRAAPDAPSEHAQYGYMADMQAMFLQPNPATGGVDETHPMTMTTLPVPSADRLTICDATKPLDQSTENVDVIPQQKETHYGVSTFATLQGSKWPTSATVVLRGSGEHETRLLDAALHRNVPIRTRVASDNCSDTLL